MAASCTAEHAPFHEQAIASLSSLKHLRQLAAKHAVEAAEGEQLRYARTLVWNIIGLTWDRWVGHAELRLTPYEHEHDLDLPLSAEVLSTATSLASHFAGKTLEDAAFEISHFYTTLLPGRLRSHNGAFYTPPVVANYLIDEAITRGIDLRTARVLDPASGGGAFLLPVAKRMAEALAGTNDRILLRSIKARLTGWELDPFAAWMSNVFLEAVLLEHIRPENRFPPVVEVADSLQFDFHPTFDLVIGNPPYGRLKLEPQLRERFAAGLYGHANLYGLFTELSVEMAKPGGLVALVTPTSFLGGQYFKNLRLKLGKTAHPLALSLVSTRTGVFDDVLQETVLTIYSRGAPRSRVDIELISPTGAGTLSVAGIGQTTLPSDLSEPWIMPRAPDDLKLLRKASKFKDRLVDWGYKVSTGPLVWNRHKHQLHDSQRQSCVPIIWAEAVGTDGSFSLAYDRRGHVPFIAIDESSEWLRLSSPCVLVQRTTAKEQPRRLISAALTQKQMAKHPGGVTVENHLNMILPTTEGTAVALETLSAFINTKIIDRLFRCLSGSVAVSAYELAAIPLPPASSLAGFSRLVAEGKLEEAELEAARIYGV